MEQLDLFPGTMTQDRYSSISRLIRKSWTDRKFRIGQDAYLITTESGKSVISRYMVVGMVFKPEIEDIVYFLLVIETNGRNSLSTEIMEFGGWELFTSEHEAKYFLEKGGIE